MKHSELFELTLGKWEAMAPAEEEKKEDEEIRIEEETKEDDETKTEERKEDDKEIDEGSKVDPDVAKKNAVKKDASAQILTRNQLPRLPHQLNLLPSLLLRKKVHMMKTVVRRMRNLSLRRLHLHSQQLLLRRQKALLMRSSRSPLFLLCLDILSSRWTSLSACTCSTSLP